MNAQPQLNQLKHKIGEELTLDTVIKLAGPVKVTVLDRYHGYMPVSLSLDSTYQQMPSFLSKEVTTDSERKAKKDFKFDHDSLHNKIQCLLIGDSANPVPNYSWDSMFDLIYDPNNPSSKVGDQAEATFKGATDYDVNNYGMIWAYPGIEDKSRTGEYSNSKLFAAISKGINDVKGRMISLLTDHYMEQLESERGSAYIGDARRRICEKAATNVILAHNADICKNVMMMYERAFKTMFQDTFNGMEETLGGFSLYNVFTYPLDSIQLTFKPIIQESEVLKTVPLRPAA